MEQMEGRSTDEVYRRFCQKASFSARALTREIISA
jgi:hypothetical protein